jgi:SRF-type transcription factor (DNA-binding and dimerisation domain)
MKLRKINTATKRRSESPKAKRQQQDRRGESLFKKVYEYSAECDAEVFLGIRFKRNGQIFLFNSEKTREWLLPDGQIVGYFAFQILYRLTQIRTDIIQCPFNLPYRTSNKKIRRAWES